MSLILLIILSLSFSIVLGRLVGKRNDFYNNLWSPARLLVQGKNPYDASSLDVELAPLWSPMTITLFAPLGWLDEQTATQIWFLLNNAALAVIVYLAVGKRASPMITLSAGLLAFLFPPTISHLVLGQVSILSILSLLLAAIFAKRKQTWLAALFLVLGSGKPQLSYLAAIGLVTLSYQYGGLRQTLRFCAWVLLSCALLNLPLFLTGTAWITTFISNLESNPPWLQPSLFSLLRIALGHWAFPAWIVISITGAWVCVQMWRKQDPLPAIVWTLGITALTAPYLWSWDFVLLLPAWIFVYSRTDSTMRILLFFVYTAVWMGMALIQIKANAVNFLYWWVPLFILGSAGLAAIFAKSRITAKNTPEFQ